VPRALAIALGRRAIGCGSRAPRARGLGAAGGTEADLRGESGYSRAPRGDYPWPLGKALMLYLQAFDYQSGSKVPYRDLDMAGWKVGSRGFWNWTRAANTLLAASRLYAEVPVEAKQRSMLRVRLSQFLLDPNRRWPWLAHATAIASTGSMICARTPHAERSSAYAVADDVPLWARQMEIFILEDIERAGNCPSHHRGYLQSGG